LENNDAHTVESYPIFRRNLPPPSSETENRPNPEPEFLKITAVRTSNSTIFILSTGKKTGSKKTKKMIPFLRTERAKKLLQKMITTAMMTMMMMKTTTYFPF
jgi:hypothetical protein